MLGRKVVEGKQYRTILGQAGHRPVVLRAVLADEAIEGDLGVGTALGFVDRVQILLGLAVHRLARR